MFLLINKPKGISSFAVVREIRKITGVKKVGHGGTLDPAACGLLIVALGRQSTKQLSKILKNSKKTYEAEIFLGKQTSTDDADGEVIKTSNIESPSNGVVAEALRKYVGTIQQLPPTYSAIKISGKKSYELAREGKIQKLKKRTVTIHSLQLLRYSSMKIKIKTVVSSGVYIRSLARDVGISLGTYAYLSYLNRIKIGKHELENATPLSLLTKANWKKYAVEEI